MPGRQFNNGNYRYGFNGKENDNEVKGTGNQQDYGMRIYDPRIGKFLSVDPLTSKYPELTPYQFASNTPIQAIDLDGLEAFFVHGTTNFDVGGKNFGIAAYKFKGNSDLVNGIASTFGNTTKDVGFSCLAIILMKRENLAVFNSQCTYSRTENLANQ
jgi:RHS repeat-associated protein